MKPAWSLYLVALAVCAAALLRPPPVHALRVTPVSGAVEAYDSALVTFGREPADLREVTAAVVEVSASKGCGVVLDASDAVLNATGGWIAASALNQILERCRSYSEFLRKLQGLPGISGALTRVGYTMPGLDIKMGFYWRYNENTDDIFLTVNEIPADVWNAISGRIRSVNVTLTRERGSYYNEIFTYGGTRAMFYTQGAIWILCAIFNMWFLLSIFRKSKRLNIHGTIVLIALTFVSERLIGSFMAEPAGPTLLWYFETVLSWMNMMNGLTCYTMVILQWSKTVHIIRGSNFLIRHEMKILGFYYLLVLLVGLFQTLRFTVNWTSGGLATTLVIGILVVIESFLLFFYGFKILIILVKGSALHRQPPTVEKKGLGNSLPVALTDPQSVLAEIETDQTEMASRPTSSLAIEPSSEASLFEASSKTNLFEPLSKSENTLHGLSAPAQDPTGVPARPNSVAVQPSRLLSSTEAIKSLHNEIKKSILHRNLTILILVAGLSLLAVAVISVTFGLAGLSARLYITPSYYFNYQITRELFLLILERTIILYLYVIHSSRDGPSSAHSPGSSSAPHPASSHPHPLASSQHTASQQLLARPRLTSVQDRRMSASTLAGGSVYKSASNLLVLDHIGVAEPDLGTIHADDDHDVTSAIAVSTGSCPVDAEKHRDPVAAVGDSEPADPGLELQETTGTANRRRSQMPALPPASPTVAHGPKSSPSMAFLDRELDDIMSM